MHHINAFPAIATSCTTLGRPVTHGVTIPPIGPTNTGASPTNTNAGGGGGSPTNTSKSNSGGSDPGPPVGAIVGGVVGGVALIAAIALLVFFLKRKNKNDQQPAPAGNGYVPGGPSSDPNRQTMGPGAQLGGVQGYYPVPQSGTPPPQMQQYNNMGAMPAGGQAGAYNPNAQAPWQPQGPTGNTQYGGNQFNPYAATTNSSVGGAPQQYGQPQMNQNLGQAGFVAGAMHDNRTSTYAPSTYTTSTNAPYQPTMSPGPVSSIPSSGSQRIPSPPAASISQAPLIVPQQYPITESFTHAHLPSSSTPAPGTQADSPPAYEGANLQPGGASAPAPLSQQEVELISQRVANIMNANGQAPDAAHIGKLVGEHRKN